MNITHNPAVTETKTVEVAPATITLQLSIEEATALRALTGHTAGGLMARLGLTKLDKEMRSAAQAGLFPLRYADSY